MRPNVRLCVLGLLVATGFSLAQTETKPVLQIRLVLSQASADSEEMTLPRRTSSGVSLPEVLIVAKGALLDDSDVKEAKADRHPGTEAPQVAITLTQQGRKAFAEVTRTNLNKRLAILIDGKPLLAPVIRSEIPNGQLIITGNLSQREAVELAERLNQAVRQRTERQVKPWRHGLYDAR